jgi:hypothetical protein
MGAEQLNVFPWLSKAVSPPMSPKAAKVLGKEAVSIPKPRVARKEWASAGSASSIAVPVGPNNFKLGQVRKRKSKRLSKKPESPFSIGDRVWARWDEDGLFYRAEIVLHDQTQAKEFSLVFTDYGNTQECTLDQLRPLDDPVMLGLAGIELNAAQRTVDRSARPISVAISKEALAQAQREEEDETWSRLQAKTAAKKRAETESKAIADAIALATELTRKEKDSVNEEDAPPPRYSVVIGKQIENDSNSINGTLLHHEVMALAAEIGALGGDEADSLDLKMQSLSREIELAETMGDTGTAEQLREEVENVRNEILNLQPPAKALPKEPEEEEMDDELIIVSAKKGPPPAAPASDSDSDLEEESSREQDDDDDDDVDDGNENDDAIGEDEHNAGHDEDDDGETGQDEEWTAEDYYEERQYEECLARVDVEMSRKRQEGILDESYIELVLLKGKCFMRLKDEKALETLEYAESLAKVESGPVSYIFVECLVLKSKVLNQLGRGEESLEATRNVCQLVAELKRL